MKRMLKFVFAVALVGALATGAGAYTAGTIPSGHGINDFIPLFGATHTEIGGYYGGQLYLSGGGGAATITADYFGAEASYTNTFDWNSGAGYITQFTHTSGNDIPATLTPLDTHILNVSDGLLPFRFSYNATAGFVVNGSNPDDSAHNTFPNFFVSFDPTIQAAGGATSGTYVWLFLDDGVFGTDDNHDDFGVRLTVSDGNISTVPIPAAVWLLGSGLLGLAGIRRRFRK